MAISTGEDSGISGADGVRKAKRWLTLSTRTERVWTAEDGVFREFLVFAWPHVPPRKHANFSLDLGGRFRGGATHGQSFVAEVKNYRKERDLPTHFQDFITKCYVVVRDHPHRADHLLWISWSPFDASNWDGHTSPASIISALTSSGLRERVFNTEDADEILGLIDHEVVGKISGRIWLVTMNDRLQELELLEQHYQQIAGMISKDEVYS